jgi:hypothetical protein
MSETSRLIKDSLQGNKQSDIDYPLQLLKEALAEYLPFLSVDFCVCDVCHMTVSVNKFPQHVEEFHFEPERPWNKEKRKRMGIDQTYRRVAL